MNVHDLRMMASAEPGRHRTEVFFENGLFKARMISIGAAATIPTCVMATYVLFSVLEGEVELSRNDERVLMKTGMVFITDPASISMTSPNGAKLLGLQLKGSDV